MYNILYARRHPFPANSTKEYINRVLALKIRWPDDERQKRLEEEERRRDEEIAKTGKVTPETAEALQDAMEKAKRFDVSEDAKDMLRLVRKYSSNGKASILLKTVFSD